MSPGVFSSASDNSMCSGADSASKNKYQDIPGGKGGRYIRLTTYHLHVPNVKKSGVLNVLEPCGPVQAFNEIALPLPLYFPQHYFCTSTYPLISMTEYCAICWVLHVIKVLLPTEKKNKTPDTNLITRANLGLGRLGSCLGRSIWRGGF